MRAGSQTPVALDTKTSSSGIDKPSVSSHGSIKIVTSKLRRNSRAMQFIADFSIEILINQLVLSELC